MPTYVALLRGINVGKHKRISMEDLRALVKNFGGTDVRTYVNSGNVVFASEQTVAGTIARDIAAAFRGHIGQDVPVVVRTAAEMEAIVKKNPFPEVEGEPKLLHVSFLDDTPDPKGVPLLDEIETGADRVRLIGREVFIHYPNGITGATLQQGQYERALGVSSTSRNWSTVTKLAEMANEP
jgi:uncharacterized protein (DUF1697 family)